MNNKIKIKVTCRNSKRFIEELILNNINLYDININNNVIEAIIDKNELDKINDIKLVHKISIIEYYGINKIVYLIKKYKIFVLSILVGIIINILLSNIVFKVEVDTPNKKLEKIILSDLDNYGIKKFNLKKSYTKISQIKELILEQENKKIEWLEIEEHGTKYIVKVEPKKINKKEDKCIERNIISKKNAVITKIISDEGEIVKKKNDYVEKNEVLISGLIHNKEKIVSKKCAVGKVYGEVWYKVKLEIPTTYNEEELLNNHSYGVSINWLNKKYDINHKYPQYEKKEYNIIGTNLINLNIKYVKYIQKKIIQKRYSIKSLEKKALQETEKQVKSRGKILNKKVLKKTKKNSKIIIDVFVSVEEDITAYQDISSLDINKINEENTKKE